MKNLNEEVNKIKHLFNFKKGDVITESMLNEQEDSMEYKIRYVFDPNVTTPLDPTPKQKYLYLMRKKGGGNDDWVEMENLSNDEKTSLQSTYTETHKNMKEIPFEEEFNIDELDRMYVRQKDDDYPKYQSEPMYINNEKDRKAIMFWRGQESEVFTL